MMRGIPILERFQKLSESQRYYAVSWMVGNLDMCANGFTTPDKDADKASFGLDRLESAIFEAEKQALKMSNEDKKKIEELKRRIEELEKAKITIVPLPVPVYPPPAIPIYTPPNPYPWSPSTTWWGYYYVT